MATQTGSIDLKAAKSANDEASKVATNYLAVDTSGIMVYDGTNGTQTPSNPDADTNNVFIDEDSLDIRKGTTVLATFGADGAQIGQTGESHLEIDCHSFKMIDMHDNVYANISDLREDNDAYEMVETFDGDGRLFVFNLISKATDTNYSVTLNGAEVASSEITKQTTRFSFSTTPAEGDVIVATYYSSDDNLKAYTFGTRGSGFVAPLSYVEGVGNDAGGYISHAEGYYTKAMGEKSHAEGHAAVANGNYSHAEGYHSKANGTWTHAEGYYTEANGDFSHAQGVNTIASGGSQTAIGEYNIEDKPSKPYYHGQYAFIIGNGTADNARSNALTVDWQGDVQLALDTTSASGTDHDLYAAITALGWQSEVIV